jgi:ubiquinone/menaquinone biosynthesis C-methylase UbiE
MKEKNVSSFEEWKKVYEKPEKFDFLSEWFDPNEIELKTLLHLIDFREKTVLDVGAGAGRLTIPISKIASKVCAIEPEEEMVQYMEEKIIKLGIKNKTEIKKASVEKIPYPNNYFDVIICAWVAGHFKDFKKGFSEIKRVLKNGGFLLIIGHNGNDEWEKLSIMEDTSFVEVYKERYNRIMKEIEDFKNIQTKVIDNFITFPNLEIAENVIRDVRGLKAAKYVKKNKILKILNKMLIICAKK